MERKRQVKRRMERTSKKEKKGMEKKGRGIDGESKTEAEDNKGRRGNA